MSNAQFLEIANTLILCTVADLEKAIEDRSEAPIRAMVTAVAMRIIEKGDAHAFDVLLDRLIGKVRDSVDLSGHAGAPPLVLSLPTNGREAVCALSR